MSCFSVWKTFITKEIIDFCREKDPARMSALEDENSNGEYQALIDDDATRNDSLVS